jgi:5'-methylthioadenosine phosphorylase
MTMAEHALPIDIEQGAPPLVGIIGGSGLYDLIEPGSAERMAVHTPYGSPSSDVMLGTFAGRRVSFLTRHGSGHTVPPHKINYRANVWALASLGVTAIVTSSAVGSVSPSLAPGSFVLPDQLIDRTSGREDTFFDGTEVQHLPLADPYCPALRAVAAESLAALGETFTPAGTTVVIQGPRFSTRAESRWFRAAGADIVNMTQYPEVALAAELNVGLVNLSFVTDTDAGSEAGLVDSAVNAQVVFERMAAAQPRILAAIAAIVGAIPHDYEPRRLIDPDVVARLLPVDTVTPVA